MAARKPKPAPPAEPEAAPPPESEETAVAPAGLGMGGLGDFDEKSFADELTPESEAPKGEATGESIRDEMGNVVPRLELVKVKHGGAEIFAFENGEKVKALQGVVVAHTRHNSFFEGAFEDHETGDRPPCFSNDGTTVAERSEDPKAESCRACERNCDAPRGSAARKAAFDLREKDRDASCNNYLSLAFALPGSEVPVVVRLSSSSFVPWATYVQNLGTRNRHRHYEVGTKITLKTKKGPGGSEISIAVFESLGVLSPALQGAFKAQRANYLSLLRREVEELDRHDENVEAAAEVNAAKGEEAKAKAAAETDGAGL